VDLIKCPICGESYHPSYRRCPFCEEEQTPRKIGRKPRRTTNKRHAQSARGGLAAALVIVLALLTWRLFGDKIAAKFRADTPEPPGSETVTPVRNPDDPFVDPDPQPVTPDPQPVEPDPAPLPDVTGARLSNNDFTAEPGNNVQLRVSGTDAKVVWRTENAAVATISDGGLVTCAAAGTTNVTATVHGLDNGEEKDRVLTCIVRVKGTGTGTGSGTADVSNARLNKLDITCKVGEKVQLRVTGTDASVTWSSKNTSIVTVNGSGLITCVGRGTTSVYAKVGDRTLECIVRVNRE